MEARMFSKWLQITNVTGKPMCGKLRLEGKSFLFTEPKTIVKEAAQHCVKFACFHQDLPFEVMTISLPVTVTTWFRSPVHTQTHKADTMTIDFNCFPSVVGWRRLELRKFMTENLSRDCWCLKATRRSSVENNEEALEQTHKCPGLQMRYDKGRKSLVNSTLIYVTNCRFPLKLRHSWDFSLKAPPSQGSLSSCTFISINYDRVQTAEDEKRFWREWEVFDGRVTAFNLWFPWKSTRHLLRAFPSLCCQDTRPETIFVSIYPTQGNSPINSPKSLWIKLFWWKIKYGETFHVVLPYPQKCLPFLFHIKRNLSTLCAKKLTQKVSLRSGKVSVKGAKGDLFFRKWIKNENSFPIRSSTKNVEHILLYAAVFVSDPPANSFNSFCCQLPILPSPLSAWHFWDGVKSESARKTFEKLHSCFCLLPASDFLLF